MSGTLYFFADSIVELAESLSGRVPFEWDLK